MTIGVDVVEPIVDSRSARQVERDTRRHEKTAQKRLTSKGATIAAAAAEIPAIARRLDDAFPRQSRRDLMHRASLLRASGA